MGREVCKHFVPIELECHECRREDYEYKTDEQKDKETIASLRKEVEELKNCDTYPRCGQCRECLRAEVKRWEDLFCSDREHQENAALKAGERISALEKAGDAYKKDHDDNNCQGWVERRGGFLEPILLDKPCNCKLCKAWCKAKGE